MSHYGNKLRLSSPNAASVFQGFLEGAEDASYNRTSTRHHDGTIRNTHNFQIVTTSFDLENSVKIAEMPEEMQIEALKCATEAQKKYQKDVDIARFIMEYFEKKYGPFWTCVVGDNFASYTRHDNNRYICFVLGEKKILLFKMIH